MSPDPTLRYQAPTEEARSPRPVKSAFNLDARHNTYSDSTNLPHGFTPHFPGTVYPRVCGGTASALSGLVSHEGLSPRVRGNHRKLELPALL